MLAKRLDRQAPKAQLARPSGLALIIGLAWDFGRCAKHKPQGNHICDMSLPEGQRHVTTQNAAKLKANRGAKVWFLGFGRARALALEYNVPHCWLSWPTAPPVGAVKSALYEGAARSMP